MAPVPQTEKRVAITARCRPRICPCLREAARCSDILLKCYQPQHLPRPIAISICLLSGWWCALEANGWKNPHFRRRATRGSRWRMVVTMMRKCRAARTLLVACCRAKIVPKAFGIIIIFQIPKRTILVLAEVGERAPGINIVMFNGGHVVPSRQRRATPRQRRATQYGHARNDDPL